MEAIEKSSKSSGEEEVNLALLTDGLKAEREQKITIDVAYRYFATPKRKFIIADTPGHVQYTRNMVTGASTAELAIVLLDASKGVLTQSRRHAFISSLLRIPHLVVAVNKMDLVDYSEERFNEIVQDFRQFARKLEIDNITYIPISALKGDNVVSKSRPVKTFKGNKGASNDEIEEDYMPWYHGSTLLHHLETVKVDASENVIDFRFPVQYVIRPNQNFRGFSGRVASGRIKPGDEITALPGKQKSRIKEIIRNGEKSNEAFVGDSVVLTIEDEIDISRGDMIVRRNNVPHITSDLEAYICWMNNEAMVTGKPYQLMHTTRVTQVYFDEVIYRMNVDTLSREDADHLELNEIGRVKLTVSHPLFIDAYQVNQKTGSFIVIDPDTNVTVGAGMIRAGSTEKDKKEEIKIKSGEKAGRPKSPDVVWEPWNITREEREKRNGHKAKVIWFTGISGAGKSTIAKVLERKLWESGKKTILLDGDQVRYGLNGDLGFSPEERTENIRRVGELAKLFFEHGNIVICTFVSPYKTDRDRVRALFPDDRFLEIYVKCSPETAQKRDPKGLYEKAQKGEIKNLTGFNSVYEEPDSDGVLVIDTEGKSVEECVKEVLSVEF